MNTSVRRLLAVTCALAFVSGCTPATARERTIQTHSEPDGRRHPETFDVNANATITCARAQNRDNDGGCYVRNVSGDPKELKPGDSITASTAGKVTFACTGSDAIFCAVDVKD